MIKNRFASAAAFALASVMPLGGMACEDLRDGPRGRVTEVVDGDTVLLDSGEQVRLIGIQAPKLPLGREGFEAWPLGEEAKKALSGLLLGADVVLRYGGTRMDRHGRILAHVFKTGDEEVWAQKAMVAAGLARVYSFPDNRFCLLELYAVEAKARAEGLGVWAHPFYQLRRADHASELLELDNHYELVEGRVLKAERGGRARLSQFRAALEQRFHHCIGPHGAEDLQAQRDRSVQL